MINDDDFRESVEDILNNPNAYTKEELYTAFQEMTERYLNEMVTTTSLERALTAGMDKEAANKLLESIATSDPVVEDLDLTNAQEPDLTEVIRNLLDYIEFELGISF